MPPDTSAPAPTESSNDKIAEQIRTAFRQENRLSGENLQVEVTDERVVLQGEVSGKDERALAERLVNDYAETRKIVNNLSVRK